MNDNRKRQIANFTIVAALLGLMWVCWEKGGKVEIKPSRTFSNHSTYAIWVDYSGGKNPAAHQTITAVPSPAIIRVTVPLKRKREVISTCIPDGVDCGAVFTMDGKPFVLEFIDTSGETEFDIDNPKGGRIE